MPSARTLETLEHLSPRCEVERLQAVYQSYGQDQTVYQRWAASNPGNRAVVGQRTRRLKRLLHHGGFLPLTRYRVLDAGCGGGSVLAELQDWGAVSGNLYGVDLLPERIELARRQFPHLHFQQANAEQLDFPDGSFDLVFLFTVFTSILDKQMAGNVANEVTRILKPGGGVVWYDFRYNNPRNTNVRGVSKPTIRQLFPNFIVRLQPITLLPPLARRLGPSTPLLYPVLSLVPWLQTHYLGLLRKPETSK